MPYKDPIRQRLAKHYWYLAHKSEVRTRTKNKRNLVKRFIDEYKLKHSTCKDCGISYPPYMLDFDHLRDKEIQMARAVNRGLNIDKIKKEIKKCEIVCSNCHRQRTWSRSVLNRGGSSKEEHQVVNLEAEIS